MAAIKVLCERLTLYSVIITGFIILLKFQNGWTDLFGETVKKPIAIIAFVCGIISFVLLLIHNSVKLISFWIKWNIFKYDLKGYGKKNTGRRKELWEKAENAWNYMSHIEAMGYVLGRKTYEEIYPLAQQQPLLQQQTIVSE